MSVARTFKMPRAVPKYAWMPPSKAAFNALHRAHHDSEVRAISILSIELWSHVLSSLPLSLFPPGKTCWPLQKRKCMTTCSLSRIKFLFFFIAIYLVSNHLLSEYCFSILSLDI
jgi:hypothetical protein